MFIFSNMQLLRRRQSESKKRSRDQLDTWQWNPESDIEEEDAREAEAVGAEAGGTQTITVEQVDRVDSGL